MRKKNHFAYSIEVVFCKLVPLRLFPLCLKSEEVSKRTLHSKSGKFKMQIEQKLTCEKRIQAPNAES